MEREEIVQFFDEYGNSIYRLALSYMKNVPDAEDVVQEVLIKRMVRAPKFESSEHEKAWTIRVTINLCKNKLTSLHRKKRADVSETLHLASEMEEDDRGVLEAVFRLPENYRTAIHLYYYEGYKTEEIARILGKKDATVRSYLHRGREILKKELGEVVDFE